VCVCVHSSLPLVWHSLLQAGATKSLSAVLDSLISKARADCSDALRSLLAARNGCAGLALLRGRPEEGAGPLCVVRVPEALPPLPIPFDPFSLYLPPFSHTPQPLRSTRAWSGLRTATRRAPKPALTLTSFKCSMR
jgi:hypothetical protein